MAWHSEQRLAEIHFANKLAIGSGLDCHRDCIGEVKVAAELQAEGSRAHGSIDWFMLFRDFTAVVVVGQSLVTFRGFCTSAYLNGTPSLLDGFSQKLYNLGTG